MKITNISVSVGATINLGNFESLRLDYSASALLDDREGMEYSIDVLRDELTTKMKTDLVASNGGRNLLLKK